MKENYTDITFIKDRSGSMQTIKSDMEGSFNAYIEKQKSDKTDDTRVSLVQFDDVIETLYVERPLADVEPLVIVPRNGTALYDAIGQTINNIGVRLASKPEHERPSKVLVVIVTDGGENASYRFTRDDIFGMITKQKQEFNWEFIFMGANQDAYAIGQGLGIDAGKSFVYATNKHGIDGSFGYLDRATTVLRSCNFVPDATADDRAAAMGEAAKASQPWNPIDPTWPQEPGQAESEAELDK